MTAPKNVSGPAPAAQSAAGEPNRVQAGPDTPTRRIVREVGHTLAALAFPAATVAVMVVGVYLTLVP